MESLDIKQTTAPDIALDAALAYLALGFSVIPLEPGDKKPLFAWAKYQKTKATEDEVRGWFLRNPEANIGIVTGQASGVVVVDVDDDEAPKQLKLPFPDTIKVKTGRKGGMHYYYRYPGRSVPCGVKIAGLGIDIRGDGGYVVAPPSVHPSGVKYEWLSPLDISKLGDAPDWILHHHEVENVKGAVDKPLTDIREGVEEGRRNDSATRFIGSLLHAQPEDIWESVAWPQTIEWNDRNSPPLDHKELRATFDSITGRERRTRITPYPVITAAQLLSSEEVQIEWLIEGLLPTGTVLILSGHPGSYKSFISLHVALSVAAGAKVFGHLVTRKAPVLYVDEDCGDPRLMRDRTPPLTSTGVKDVSFLFRSHFRLDDPASVDRLTETVKQLGAGLVILDALTGLHGQDENSSGQMRRVIESARRLTKSGASVLIIHHRRKDNFLGTNRGAQSLRGSSDILAASDGHLVLDLRGEYIVVRQEKSRYSRPIAPFRISATPEGDQPFRYLGGEDGSSQTEKDRQGAILDLLETGGLTWIRALEESLREMACSKTIRKSIDLLVRAGRIEAKVVDQKKYYQLRETAEGLETGTHP